MLSLFSIVKMNANCAELCRVGNLEADFHHKNICCGYSLEAPQQGTSNEYPQRMFLWK